MAQAEAEARAEANIAQEHSLLVKVQKEHASAIKALEKVHLKEAKAKKKHDAKVEKLEKAYKASVAQTDKHAKKIKDLQKKKEKINGSVNSRTTKAQSVVKKAEAKHASAQRKLAEAEARREPPKTLYKLQDAVDKEERNVLAARKAAEQVPEMIRLEANKIENQCNELTTKTKAEQDKNRDKLRAAAHERDVTLTKLVADKAKAQLAVQQYERRLGSQKDRVGNAQDIHRQATQQPAEEGHHEDEGHGEGEQPHDAAHEGTREGEGMGEHGESAPHDEGIAHHEGSPAPTPAPQQ